MSVGVDLNACCTHKFLICIGVDVKIEADFMLVFMLFRRIVVLVLIIRKILMCFAVVTGEEGVLLVAIILCTWYWNIWLYCYYTVLDNIALLLLY